MDSKLCEFKASPSCQSVLGFMLAVEVLRCESSASCSSPHSCHWLLCLPSGMNSNLLELYAQINSSRSCFQSGHFIIATEKPPICRDKRPQLEEAGLTLALDSSAWSMVRMLKQQEFEASGHITSTDKKQEVMNVPKCSV